ncbi:hypothetical protein B9Z19DRAFT_279783 [Tuber borchii]|uniref:Uncharacterized protein n=1 Tax=Tuber borchii TaxID=42251 RepID=A0A2T7A5D1_TUBBO|nr:hypothetical protein B9Z19DRAFT_279783 [Tuber borchii]
MIAAFLHRKCFPERPSTHPNPKQYAQIRSPFLKTNPDPQPWSYGRIPNAFPKTNPCPKSKPYAQSSHRISESYNCIVLHIPCSRMLIWIHFHYSLSYRYRPLRCASPPSRVHPASTQMQHEYNPPMIPLLTLHPAKAILRLTHLSHMTTKQFRSYYST